MASEGFPHGAEAIYTMTDVKADGDRSPSPHRGSRGAERLCPPAAYHHVPVREVSDGNACLEFRLTLKLNSTQFRIICTGPASSWPSCSVQAHV